MHHDVKRETERASRRERERERERERVGVRADNHERRARRELAKGTGGKARIESKTQVC